MQSTPKMLLRKDRFYIKPKSIKKKRALKKKIQKEVDTRSNQLNDLEKSDNQFENQEVDDRDEFEDEIDDRDIENQEVDDRDDFEIPDHGEKQVLCADKISIVEQENSDQNRDENNDIPFNHEENDDIPVDREGNKSLKKESKICEGLKKDMASMNDKIDPLIRDFKALKTTIKRWGSRPEFSTDDEIEDFNELPRLPLTKRKRVKLMEENARNNRAYQKQLVSETLYRFIYDLNNTVCYIV